MATSSMTIIDAHAHCGILDDSWPQSVDDYARHIEGTDISAVAFFSPVYEIYDRYDRQFVDTPSWQQRRQKSNAHLLTLQPTDLTIYPYFFIWNDFAIDQLTPAHHGIKWHRHAGEPVYHYEDPGCRSALDEIRRRNLPIVLEEEFDHTVRFIREMAGGIRVIIPHLGGLNGGFRAIAAAGLWEMENVWADTALASREEIREYLLHYDHKRLLFGSDFPFGHPAQELRKVRSMDFDRAVESAVLGGNFLRLQSEV